MTSNKPPSLAPEVGHIEPLPTPKGISITDFRTLSIHPTIITRPPKTHIIPTIDFRMPGTYPAIVTKPPATYQSSPLLKPGMGLAVETWLHIINFLELEPVALLACALTCHCLRKPAQDMIRALLGPTISTYHDLDALVEEARESPVRARCISGLKIIPEGDKESIPVFSVVPFRLARMLDRIKTLKIGHRWGGGCNTISGHACTWSFYGRAFRSITRLKLYRVCFPSFFDFTSFIISFPALTHLFIQRVQCRSQGVPVSAMQRYQKQGFRLETLCVSSEGQEQDANVRFLAAFVSWFIQRRGIEVRALTMASRIPQSHELVQRLQGHLQTLSLSPEPTSEHSYPLFFDIISHSLCACTQAQTFPKSGLTRFEGWKSMYSEQTLFLGYKPIYHISIPPNLSQSYALKSVLQKRISTTLLGRFLT